MSELTRTIFAVVGFFIIGFIIVGTSGKSDKELADIAVIRAYQQMSTMASSKCPAVIKKHTGETVYEVSDSETDKQTYVKLTWTSDKGKFKRAECTLAQRVGGVSELIIDGNTVISK